MPVRHRRLEGRSRSAPRRLDFVDAVLDRPRPGRHRSASRRTSSASSSAPTSPPPTAGARSTAGPRCGHRGRRVPLTRIALALGAALGWGIADFVGGRDQPGESRRWSCSGASQWVGFAIVLVAARDRRARRADRRATCSSPAAAGADADARTRGAVRGDDGRRDVDRGADRGHRGRAYRWPSASQAATTPAACRRPASSRRSAGSLLCSHDPRERAGRRAESPPASGWRCVAAVGGGLTSTALGGCELGRGALGAAGAAGRPPARSR